MKALIIAPIPGGRHRDLVEQLSYLENVDVQIVPAQVLTSFPKEFDQRLAKALHNHELLPGDVGCASSHLAAWKQVSRSLDPWTLIFEDDARITDLEALRSFIVEVAKLDPVNPTAVSLYSENALLKYSRSSSFADCLMEPSFAVGYCLTRSAAEKLVVANRELGFCSDWPRASGVSFKLSKQSFLAHGDATTHSYVGNRNLDPLRRGIFGGRFAWKAVFNRLEVYGFIHYFRFRSYFEGPSDYYRKVLRHRLVWHLARTLFRWKKLRPGVHVATFKRLA